MEKLRCKIIIILILILSLLNTSTASFISYQQVISKITIIGRGSSSTYVSVNQPYYLAIDVPDATICVPSIVHINNNIYFTHNIINDTLLLSWKEQYKVLIILKGYNQTHTTFDIYLIDVRTGKNMYLGDLSSYNIFFPKIFYKSHILYFNGLILNDDKLLITVYMRSLQELIAELILIQIIDYYGYSLKVLEARVVKGLVYYTLIPRYNIFLAIIQNPVNVVKLTLMQEPIYDNDNITLTINTSLTTYILPQFTDIIVNGSTIWILLQYYTCKGYLSDYLADIYFIGLDIINKRINHVFHYKSNDPSYPVRYNAAKIKNNKIYYMTLNKLLIYNTRSNNITAIVNLNNTLIGCSIIFMSNDFKKIYVINSSTTLEGLCTLPESIVVYTLTRSGTYNHTIFNITRINPYNRVRIYDTIGSHYKRYSRYDIIILPFYEYDEEYGKIYYGLQYLVFTPHDTVYNDILYLDNMSIWNIPNTTTSMELELYSADVDRDKLMETVAILKYYRVDNRYVINIYIINDDKLLKINPLPEFNYVSLIFFVLIATLVLKNRSK